MTSPIRVVYTTDENYAIPLAASMRSLVDNTSEVERLAVTVLTPDLTEETQDRLRVSCPEIELDVMTVSTSTFDGLPLPMHEYWTATTYLRLLIPNLIDTDDPIIYLDSDTIVLGDVRELDETPRTGSPVAAVIDPLAPRFDSAHGVQGWADLGFDGSTPYFNNGVAVIDPVPWRKRQVTEETIAYLRKHYDKVRYLEQEAMNAVLCGDWHPIDAAWNVWSPLVGAAIVAQRLGLDSYTVQEDHAVVLDHPKCVQFVGKDKPWFAECVGTPYGRLFYHYLDRTAWAGWRPE
jgi:lipopolysaccharide biosynthesis glycosyltransferase